MKNLPLLVKLGSVLALFIIIPVTIVSIITNYSILHYAENEISRSGISQLKVARSLTELLADQVSKETLRLSLNTDLNELYQVQRYQTFLTNPDQLTLVSRSLGLIAEMVKTNPLYQSVYIYLDNTDYILSSSVHESETVIRKQEYQDTGWLKSYQKYKSQKSALSWIKTRIPKYNHTYIPDHLRNNADETLYNYVITYIYPLTPYTTKLQGAVVVNLHEEAFCKLINSNTPASDGYVFIMNQQGDVFSHVDKKLVSHNIRRQPFVAKILQREAAEGHLITKLGRKRCLVTYLKTGLNDWIYVGVFPLDTLMAVATGLRQRTILIALILVVIGVAGSLMISRKIFAPLQQLIDLIKNRREVVAPSDGNELVMISQAFDTIIQKEDQLANALEQNKRNLWEHYWVGLLRGERMPDSQPELPGAGFSGPYYLCILLAIDHYREFQQQYSASQSYPLKTALLDQAGTVFAGAYECAGLVLERERLALIVNSPENTALSLTRIKDCCGLINEAISGICAHSVSIGIGRWHAGPSEIKLSYHEAQEALKQKLTAGYGQVHLWQPASAASLKYFYPLALEKHLFNHLELGQIAQARQTIAALVATVRERPDLSYDNIIQIFNQLLGNTIQYLLESHIQVSNIFGNDSNLYQELAQEETLSDIQAWLDGVYTRIFEYRKQGETSPKSHLTCILEYLHQNYRQDIDINTLADHVGLSYSHVRKVFHDEMGENIVNYINNLRIGEAKRLLKQTKLSINEVALSLGYNNSQSFNRFFKKYEGITPGEFRSKK